jgi:uncharacterized protein (DUF433 family)
MTVATGYRYVVKDDELAHGEPLIQGTAITVRIIVEYWRLGYTPEEIQQALPHLTLAQVFDALAYFSDHQPEINGYIERNRVPESKVAKRP